MGDRDSVVATVSESGSSLGVLRPIVVYKLKLVRWDQNRTSGIRGQRGVYILLFEERGRDQAWSTATEIEPIDEHRRNSDLTLAINDRGRR